MTRFSPVAPAAIRVQVLPVGKIERSKFQDTLRALRKHASIIKLARIPQVEEHQLLSPKSFPEASLLLDYVAFPVSQQEQQLTPYELYREPLLVLGVAHGLDEEEAKQKGELKDAAYYLRERHPRVVHRHVLSLQEIEGNADAVTVLCDGDQSTSYASAMSEVAGRFLLELSTYTKAMQASPTIQTPGQPAKTLRRTSSHREDKRPNSGHTTPTQNPGIASPTGEESTSPPPRHVASPPPTNSFEQVRNASNRATTLSRSDSNASSRSEGGQRASSQDRVSVHGFGPSTSREKAKNRGKARVGIVTGHIYLMAGQWNDALRMLTEHTNTARKLSDSLWHAKGLDGILVCMLLLAWAEQGFSIPPVCFASEQRSSFAHNAKLSVTLPTDFRPTEVAYQAAVGKLSMSLPELLKHVLSLYGSSEGALELSPLARCEVRVRFCDLLATLYCENGELNGNARSYIVERARPEHPRRFAGASAVTSLPRSLVANMLAEAQPGEEDGIAASDHIQLLSGISSVYSMLGMDRKSGMLLNDMVDKVTTALIQARKIGAAEAGIHPAATLSADSDADSVANATADGGSAWEVAEKMAGIYGINLTSQIHGDGDRSLSTAPSDLGSDSMKLSVLQALIAFYEASPDPESVLRIASTMLRAASAQSALDAGPTRLSSQISKDDQIRIATSLSRTVGVSKHLGWKLVNAEYWDQFLIRGLTFEEPDISRAILSPPDIHSEAKNSQRTPSNPLIYDPNAKLRGSAVKTRMPLVCGEPLTCRLTLQNPLETAIEIESINLTTESTEDVGFRMSNPAPFTVQPVCFQQVQLSVSAASVGDFSITGCQIKVAGCREQTFPIYPLPWSPSSDTLVKYHGRDVNQMLKSGDKAESAAVALTAIEAMPLLALESTTVADETMMLLDGEHRDLGIVLRNCSESTAAAIYDVRDGEAVTKLKDTGATVDDEAIAAPIPKALVQPGKCITLQLEVLGKAGVSSSQLHVFYQREESKPETAHARVLTVPLQMTVDAALQVQHPDVSDMESDSFQLTFDICNAWPRPLSYRIEALDANPFEHLEIPPRQKMQEAVLLSPGEVQRVSKRLKRWHVLAQDCSPDEIKGELLRRISVTWRTWSGDPRWGQVDLRALNLSKEHLKTVRGQSTSMELHLAEHQELPVKVGSFVTVRLKIHRSRRPSTPLLVQLKSPQETRTLGLIGVPQRILATSSSDAEMQTTFTLCPVLPGELELSAVGRPVISGEGIVGESLTTDRPLLIEVG